MRIFDYQVVVDDHRCIEDGYVLAKNVEEALKKLKEYEKAINNPFISVEINEICSGEVYDDNGEFNKYCGSEINEETGIAKRWED